MTPRIQAMLLAAALFATGALLGFGISQASGVDAPIVVSTPGPTVTASPAITVTLYPRAPRANRSKVRIPVRHQLVHRSTHRSNQGSVSGHRPAGSWLALARCESGANLRYDDGTFQGAFNFLPSTWQGYTHGKYGPILSASWAEQTYVAWRIWRGSGWSAFPGCGDKLGHPSMPSVSAPA